MGSLVRAQQLKECLKVVLKDKGWTYRDLAESLGCSVPTVKRILGPEELTLGRLLEICAILEINLTDLERLAGSESSESKEYFTEEQEKFLADHPNFLGFLGMLFSGVSVEQIKKDFDLTKRSVDLYLIRLEKHGFLSVDVKGRVRLKKQRMPSWRPTGPLAKQRLKTVLRRFSDLIDRRVEKEFSRRDSENADRRLGIVVSSYDVPEATYLKWIKQANELMREIENEAAFEERHGPKKSNPRVILSFSHALIDPDDPEIKRMRDTLGDVTNL